MAAFKSKEEFVEVFEKLWQLIEVHPKVGPDLKKAQAPHRFTFTDLELEFNVTFSEEEGRNLRWCWGREECDWKPVVSLEMNSETANKYFQGKENVMMAVTFGRIKLSGPMSTILKLAPVTRPIESEYRDMLASEGRDHLVL